MDPWILLRLPVMMIRYGVERFGWGKLLVGWGLSILAILVYEFAT